LRRLSAPAAPKVAYTSALMPASAPPARTTSSRPERSRSSDTPSASDALAQADMTVNDMPRRPWRMAIWLPAMFGG